MGKKGFFNFIIRSSNLLTNSLMYRIKKTNNPLKCSVGMVKKNFLFIHICHLPVIFLPADTR